MITRTTFGTSTTELPPSVVNGASLEPGNLGAAQTIDFGSAPNKRVMLRGTLNANCTVTLANRAAGCRAILLLTQDGTGGRSLTISDGTNTAAVTIPSGANVSTIVELNCPDGTDIILAPLGIPGPAGSTGATGAAGGPQWGGWVRPVGMDAAAITAPAALSANTIYGCRIYIPVSGHLHDLAVYVGATSTGNVRVGVYDTGDTTGATRTLLTADTLTIAAPSVNGWRIIGDPNLAVTAGQMLDLAILADNATITFGHLALNNLNMGLLPANFIPATSALAKLNWTKAAAVSNTLDTTIAEASAVSATAFVPVIGRIA